MTPINQPRDSKESKRNKLLLWLLVAIALGLGIFFNSGRLMVFYTYAFGSKHFDVGQKVYLNEDILNAKFDNMVEPRLLRPVTEKEVRDSFFFSDEKHDEALAIAQKDGLKPFLQHLNYSIDISKLKDAHSAAIGTFVDKRIMPVKTLSGEMGTAVFYVIKPYTKIIHNDISKYELPAGYKLADNYMYVFCSTATDKEVQGIK